MLRDVLAELYERDLAKLRFEIDAYADEADLWTTSGEISNSAGNLCLHICGNLLHFLGATLADTGYIRQRDNEFSDTGVPREHLRLQIDETARVVAAALAQIADDDFLKTYPLEVFGKPMTTGFFLTHLATHLNYHLGQINYHRRLLAAGK